MKSNKMKIQDFFFSEALETLEIGHVIGGGNCTSGNSSCSSSGSNEDRDIGDADYDGPVAIEPAPSPKGPILV